MPTKNEVRLLALNEEGKENVEAVAKLLHVQKIKSSWVSSGDVLATANFEEDVIYVVDPTQVIGFAGNEVDHLVGLGFSVIGPQCALTVLKHNILLKKDLKYPVYNLTMLGCLICFSNIEPKKRAELRRKVERMGGNVTGSLTQDVSHLVVKEVGSLKYFSAAHVGIPIMTLDWIEHLWTHGQSRYISARDGKWEEFQCPIFLGCSVCVTGFSSAERNRIQKLVTKFGGIYSGAMKLDFTTHLVVHKPEGQKFAMANKFGVKVVSVDWVYRSVEKGTCQDHNKYPVKPTGSDKSSNPNSSTPERSDMHTKIPHLHDMSNISVMTVNETVAPSAGDISRISAISVPHVAAKSGKVDLLSFSPRISIDQILDGILVYVVGFNHKEEEKLYQLLSAAGATRCRELTAVVTHVLVDATNPVPHNIKSSIQAALSKSGREMYVVSYKWLLDSLKKGEVLSEFDYWMNSVADKPTNADESTYVNQVEPSTYTDKDRPTQIEFNQHSIDPGTSKRTAMHDMLSQYMNGQVEGDTTLLRNFNFTEENQQTLVNADITGKNDETTLNHTEEDATRWSFYRGLSFVLFGFDEEETNRCTDNIEKLDGRILPSYSKKVADYAVVPVIGCQFDRTATNVVTDFWIDSCFDEGRLLDANFHPMSTPFLLRDDVFPLEGCVTCLSKYQEPERSHLVAFMRELGAEYQDNVARKDLPPMRRTTHLVVMSPEGDKYVGCKKWGIPTITAEWVFACARQGTKVNEDEYAVDRAENKVESATIVEDPDVDHTDIPTIHEPAADDKTVTDLAPPQKAEVVEMLEFPPMPRPPSAVDHIRRRLEAKEKIRKEKDAMTPFKDKVLRLMDTPSKFLNVGSNLNVSFHLDEVFALLKTPIHERERMRATMKNQPDTPLSDCVDRFLKDALSNLPDVDDDVVKNLEKIFENDFTDEDQVQEEEKSKDDVTDEANDVSAADHDVKPLKGVVIYVCKKLLKQRMDAMSLVNELGGEFRWTYDSACTHFVFQGKTNDINREFRTARTDGKLIVSPHWLPACKEAGARVEERDFPHVYNPNKSIQIVPVSSQVRSKRTTRSSSQSSQVARSTRSKTRSSSTEHEQDCAVMSCKEDENLQKASQEARESLKKTLENIMSSTGKLKSATRRLSTGSRNGSYSSPSNPPPPPKRSTNQRPTLKVTSESEKPESSQDVHVIWDDPVGRAEMERIMREQNHKLSEAQGSDQDGAKLASTEGPKEAICDPPDVNDEPTHLPQDDNRLSQIIRDGRIPSFLISSVTAEQKTEYANIIEEMGGKYLDRDYFDVACSHLVVKKPARNEKFLASLASGKWILHTSYIEACRDEGVFIKEDNYEYGNPLSTWTPSNDAEAALSAAAHRWRCELNERRLKSENSDGAFAGWKVLLFVSQRHFPGFTRLLESGSGQVVARSIPYEGTDVLTHAIIDPNRLKEVSIEHIESMHKSGVHCCVPEYIADYLMKDPIPDVKNSYLPMFNGGNEHEKIQPRKRRKIS